MQQFPEQLEVLRALDPDIEQLIIKHVRKRKPYVPSDIFPGDDLPDKIVQMRINAAKLPNELKVVLFLNLMTEENLPMYTRALSYGLETKPSALSKWQNLWTAEEEGHGKMIDRYCFITKAINMRESERNLFELTKFGYNPKWGGNPYASTSYALAQEAATRVSHMNVAKQAREFDPLLQLILSIIAGDEDHHYDFYLYFYNLIIKLDPNNALQIASKMWPHIQMPGAKLNNFENYARVAQQLGIYDLPQYKIIIEKIIKFLNIGQLTNLNEVGQTAQEVIMGIPQKIQEFSERVNRSLKNKTFTADVLFGNPQIILPGA